MNIIFIIILVLTLSMFSCEDRNGEMTDNYPQDYQLNYRISKVIQYDPINISGLDIADEFDFFNMIEFDIEYTGGKISSVSYNNGTVPFKPFAFDMTSGQKYACEFDGTSSPNRLILSETGEVIATFDGGEFIMEFGLDCSSVQYKYTFESRVTD